MQYVVLGFSVADHMRTEIVLDALDQSVATRFAQVEGTVFHTTGKSVFRWQGRRLLRVRWAGPFHGSNG